METCKFINIMPSGLLLKKYPFIEFHSNDITAVWEETICNTQENLLETLIYGIFDCLENYEKKFWIELERTKNELDKNVFLDWWVKTVTFLEKHEKKLINKKKRKLRKLCGNEELYIKALKRFEEHLPCFQFKDKVMTFSDGLSVDTPYLITLLSLNESKDSDLLGLETKCNGENGASSDTPTENKCHDDSNKSNVGTLLENGRYRGKFVSPNVINLSNKELTEAEISLLSKGLKFVPTPSYINKVKLKEELESFGRRLRLMWYFRNEENNNAYNIFRPKSKFNPKGKDPSIELYLKRLEEEILAIDTKLNYSNITKEERQALKDLSKDTSIIIKEADKGSAVVVWDREDYLREAEEQLSDTQVYEEVESNAVSSLVKIIKNHITEVHLRGDIPKETIEYFLLKILN